ncbi:MAG: hypothetical protein KIG43_04780 [Eubacteriales bacterium]|nr:hypothetical protein [Eubacteriales bacterium]MCI7570952.1 hypothetical protein [Clostridiales bacterium]
MLGRLIKYDLRALSRTLIPILCIIIIAGVIAGLLFGFGLRPIVASENQQPEDALVSSAMISITIMLSILLIAFVVGGASIAVQIIVMGRFYTNLLTNEGYLSFTLPVTGTDHLVSKTLSGLIWYVLSAVAVLLAGASFILVGFGMSGIGSEIINAVDSIDIAGYFTQELTEIFSGQILLIAIQLLLSPFYSILFGYMCLTIGYKVSHKHPILVAIGVYMGVSLLLSSVLSTVMTLTSINTTVNNSEVFEAFTYIGQMTSNSMIINICVSVVMCVASFLVTQRLLTKKFDLV